MVEAPNVRPSGDFANAQRVALPRSVVATILILTALPLLLNLLGVSFSAVKAPTENLDDEVLFVHQLEVLQEVTKGEFIHSLLEWSAFSVALFTAVLAYTHYHVARDVATPVIGTALFFSGMVDAFRTLAADRVIPTIVDLDQFVPFTWAISRTINVVFLIAGMAPFVWKKLPGRLRPRDTGLRFILLSSVLYGLIAYAIIHVCAVAPSLPKAIYPQAKAAYRPWDLGPLFLYLFAGVAVFPRFNRFQPSLFSHAIMLSVIPSVAAQMHAAFLSRQLYDNDFNISLYLKIVANVVPMAGLILDYTRAYRNEVTLQLTEEKLRVARNVQLGLLPQSAPSVAGFDIAGASLPAEAVGGDYYDYLPMSDGCLGVVVADVSGHEIGGAILMAQTRAYLRALAQTRADIGGILNRLNRFLLEDVQHKWFVTLFFARLNPKASSFSYAAAGHAGYFYSHDAADETLIATTTPLGIDETERIQFAPERPMEAGDVLLLLTDGIPDARSASGKYLGMERVAEIVKENRQRTSREIVGKVIEAVKDFSGNGVLFDDVTVVVVKRLAAK